MLLIHRKSSQKQVFFVNNVKEERIKMKDRHLLSNIIVFSFTLIQFIGKCFIFLHDVEKQNALCSK